MNKQLNFSSSSIISANLKQSTQRLAYLLIHRKPLVKKKTLRFRCFVKLGKYQYVFPITETTFVRINKLSEIPRQIIAKKKRKCHGIFTWWLFFAKNRRENKKQEFISQYACQNTPCPGVLFSIREIDAFLRAALFSRYNIPKTQDCSRSRVYTHLQLFTYGKCI